MGALIKLLGFLFWAGVMPVGTGLFVTSFTPASNRKIHLVILMGYLMSFSLFEIIGLPILFLTPAGDFHLLVVLYSAAEVIFTVLGIIRIRRHGGLADTPGKAFLRHPLDTFRKDRPSPDGQTFFFWVVFFCLLGFELYMSYTRASYDGDDAYYVAQSVQTYQTGTMYHYVPYTGITTTLDGRHAMAMIPMWIAAIATLCGTHPTIVTHSMIPLIFLPLADLAYYSLICELLYGKESRKRTKRMLPAFMVCMALIQIFGNVSIYTPETFLLMRTWQGKSVFANLVVPMAFCSLLDAAHRLEKKESTAFPVLVMCLVNIASGFCTSMAPFFTAFLFLAGGLFIAIAWKKRAFFGKIILCCLPNAVYALILVRVMLPVLLGGGSL